MNRYALFVGIDNYNNDVTPLRCACNDALELSIRFSRAGFQVQKPLLNASCAEVLKAVTDLCRKMQKDDLLVFYFAGHGRELNNEHFLVGRDGYASASFYSMDSLPMSTLIAATDKPDIRRLFILDCCRDNLLAGRSTAYVCETGRSIALDNAVKGRGGFIPPLILNSCAAGENALEDISSGHGFFTSSLLRTISDRSVNSFEIFRKMLQKNMNSGVSQNICWNGNVDSWDEVKLFPGWEDPASPESVQPVPPPSAAEDAENVSGTVLTLNHDGSCLLQCTDKTATSVIIPESVRIINPLAFNQCTALKKVVLPSALQEIGDFAFENCCALREINFPENLKVIGEFAFSGCTALTFVKIPGSVRKIRKFAFAGCSGISEVELPSAPLAINSQAFSSCSALKSVWIPSLVRTSWERIFPADCRIVREKTPFLKHLYFQLTTLVMALAAAVMIIMIIIITDDTYCYGKDELQITFITICSTLFLAGNIIFFRRWHIYPKYLLPAAILLFLSLLSLVLFTI